MSKSAEVQLDSQTATDLNRKVRLPAWVLWPAATAFLATAGIYAYCMVFSRFAFYDDEGYMMISVRGFLDGNPLYDSVVTSYGPFYYFYHWAIRMLAAMPVSHDVTGSLCVLHWLGAAAIIAFAGGWGTRSVLLGFFIFMRSIVHLTGLANEPGHPQELVAMLLALATLVATRGLKRNRTVALLGAIGAALAFTKVNIGAFYGLALVLALACHCPFFQSRRAWFWGLLGLSGMLPFLLMRPHLGEDWARDYSVRTCASVLAAGAVSYAFIGDRKVCSAHWFRAAIGFISVSGIFTVVLLLAGTSFSALIDCLVTSSARLASGLWFPLRASNAMWSGAAALATATVAIAFRARLDRVHLAVCVLKGIYGFLGALWFMDAIREQLGYLLPWAWLLLLPTKSALNPEPRDSFPRVFLCLLALWEGLQAYPAAGTQAVLATFLLVPICSLCLYDAITGVAAEPSLNPHLNTLSVQTAVLCKGLVLTSLLYLFAVKWCTPRYYWQLYASQAPLELRGSRQVHLPAQQVDTYRALARYLEAECDTFVTVPGLNSLYFWTGKRPPNYSIIPEFVMLSDRQQDKVVAALQRARHPLIVLNEQKVPFELGEELTREGPLARFIREECREVKRLGTFRILAPNASVPELDTASAHSVL